MIDKIGTRKKQEDEQREKKTIDRLKDEIRALHLIYDDNIPEFKSKPHIGQKNDALKSNNLSVVKEHHAGMEFIVARYYKKEPQMRLGVIIDAEDYLSMYNLQNLPQETVGEEMGKVAKGIHTTYISGGLAVAKREPVQNRLVKSLNATHIPTKLQNPLLMPKVDTYRSFTLPRNRKPKSNITFKTLK